MRLGFAIGAVLLVPVLAMGAQMTLTVGGQSSVSANPGDNLAVVLAVDTLGAQIAAFDGYLRATVDDGLTVSAYALNPAFGFPTFAAPPNGPVTTTNATQNIGGLSFNNLGPGIVQLATFNLAVGALGIPSQLTVHGPLLSDGAGAPVSVQVTPLTITPEPVSLLLLGLGGLFLRRRTA